MKKRIKKKKSKKGIIIDRPKQVEINYTAIGKSFNILAKDLEMEEETILLISKKLSGGIQFTSENIITSDIWSKMKEFVHNKLSLNARRNIIMEAKLPKVLDHRKSKARNRRPKRKEKSKPYPYFIKGNLGKVIFNGMTN